MRTLPAIRLLLIPILFALLATRAASGAPATSLIVINEIDDDQPVTDNAEFIEIYNGSGASIDLDPYSLRLVNGVGNGASIYRTIELPAVSLEAGDYYVVCADISNVANCDLDISPDTDLIQNGDPDAVALISDGTLVDTISYGGNTGAPYTETSGDGLEDDPATPASGLSRCPDGLDNDQNNSDFSPGAISPGAANQCDSPPGACGDPAFPLHSIQGDGNARASQDTVVEVEAVVVGDFQDPTNGLAGFFLR